MGHSLAGQMHKSRVQVYQIRLAHFVGQSLGAILSEQEIRILCIAFAYWPQNCGDQNQALQCKTPRMAFNSTAAVAPQTLLMRFTATRRLL